MNTLKTTKMIYSKAVFSLLLFITLSFLSCKKDDVIAEPKLPDEINFTTAGLYPEGFAYDENAKQFLVSSITEGDIFSVKENGTISRFISDNRLISSTGVTIDAARNRVIVSIADVNASKRSSSSTAFITNAVGIYNASTGAPISFYNLGSLRPTVAHFGSEAVVDNDGNIYITDSFDPVIYKIDANGNRSVWLMDTIKFKPAPNQFGLNGIVFHPDGYLIVGKTDQGFLYKIPISNPSNNQRINVGAFPGVDGIVLDGKNNLLLAINGSNKVVRITTTDNWTTASQTGEMATPNVFPSTVNSARGDFFVIHSYINKLLAGDLTQASYKLQKVKF